MSYDKFKANVMAAKIQEERDRAAVFVTDTNREYEGVVKNVGDSVTIKGAGKVETTTTSDGQPIRLDDPKPVEGTNAIMTIKHQTTFNFMVPDIDAAQGAGGALSVYRSQAAKKIANEHDLLIAGLAKDPLARQYATAATKVTADNVLSLVDDVVTMLYESDVPATERIVLVASPKFYQLLRQNLVHLDTDNSEMLKRGALAMYNSVDIKMSNNVLKTGTNDSVDNIIVRTPKAVAFVDAITKIEGKRANNYMADEVRGLSLYDGKIVRPKEFINLAVKYE